MMIRFREIITVCALCLGATCIVVGLFLFHVDMMVVGALFIALAIVVVPIAKD